MKRSTIIVSLMIISLLVLFSLSGCSDNKAASTDESMQHSGSSGQKVVVKVTKDGFSPRSVKVKPGDKVVWKNDSDTDAQIHENNGSPADIIGPGQTYETMYHESGSVAYHNHLKSVMAGEVVVE